LGFGVLKSLKAALRTSEQKLYIQLTETSGAGFYYYRGYETIYPRAQADKVRGFISWSPFFGVSLPSGQIITPAEVLQHEAGHALRYTEHTDQYVTETDPRNRTNDGYSNAEERRALLDEARSSAIVGPRVGRGGDPLERKHSEGKWIRVTGPTSITPVT
jgi:hypothetical protein